MEHRQDLVLIIILTCAALFCGWLSDAYGWSFFVALGIWSVNQWRELRRLENWSQRPLRRPTNEVSRWQAMSNRLYRSIKRGRGRSHSVLQAHKALRIVIETLPDAALVLSKNGEIDDLNAAARRLLNLDNADRHQSLASLVRQPDFIALTKGKIDGNRVEFTSTLKESIRLEARRVPMASNRSLILVRDVTQLNRLLSMRQDFIANVSHELRTPLTVIVGYIETLLSEELDHDTTLNLVQKLRSPTDRMRALVDDLLLLTRLESSPNPGDDELTSVDMHLLMNLVSSDGRALSEARHEINCELHSTALVIGVEHELLSACLNLLTNAIRYSPDGGAITLSWTDLESGARFAVSDQGIGIPPEHLSRITERFYRVDLAKSRVRGGTGLGLAIVKHILKRHNSELKIDSQLARGSTFYFDFPESQLTRVRTTAPEPTLHSSGELP